MQIFSIQQTTLYITKPFTSLATFRLYSVSYLGCVGGKCLASSSAAAKQAAEEVARELVVVPPLEAAIIGLSSIFLIYNYSFSVIPASNQPSSNFRASVRAVAASTS